MMRKKSWLIIGAIIFSATVLSIYYQTLTATWEDYEVNLRVRRLLDLEDTIGYTNKKKILFWNSIFGENWFYLGNSAHFDHCPRYNNCYVTRYRGLVNVHEFDAILFHGNELSRLDLPESRGPRQMYVFVNLESPVDKSLDDTFFEDYFNATLTFRLDSDIPWPNNILKNIGVEQVVGPSENVEWFEPSYDPLNRKLVDFKIDKKSKMVAWIVNNCQTQGKRELYVEEFRKHIQVDVIGTCAKSGGRQCPQSKNCFAEIIELEYFFYLSFEDSLCEDYVTEQFFNALRYNVIPVVYGGANYSLFAPPHSYIDALDFESPKALANYLIELSGNRDEYLKYFWWKRMYTLDYPTSWIKCRLCELVNEPKIGGIRSPLSSWFYEDKCPLQDSIKNGFKFATKDSRSHGVEKNVTLIEIS